MPNITPFYNISRFSKSRVTVFSTSGSLGAGPLVGCKTLLCDIGFPDATSAKSLRWPSSSSDVRLCVIDDAELIVS
jgi:hypothetical protein